MLAAVAASLFAAQDDPSPTIAVFTKTAAVGVLISALYVFGILPNVHNIETLILALAPAFLAFGLLIATPQTALIGVPLAVISATAMALQETYEADAAAFLNSSIALVLGNGAGRYTSAVLITLGAEWGVWRISRANRATLAEAANTTTSNEEALVAGLMFDRMLLLAPRAAAAGHTMPDVLRELRAGFNILDLHRAQRSLPPYSRGGSMGSDKLMTALSFRNGAFRWLARRDQPRPLGDPRRERSETQRTRFWASSG